MDRRNNPYAPGTGLQPPELAGRDRLIEDVTIDLDRVLARRPTKGLVLMGPARGRQDRAAQSTARSAVGLFLDEIQYLSSVELAAVVLACHEIAQRNLPLLFIGAGLPQVAALAGKAKSYAERLFDYPEVGPLDPDAARAAIAIPARKEGVSFADGAVDAVLQATQNYPYFIQEWGFHVWNRAPSSPIARKVVADATADVIAHLDANFFRVRFDRLTVLQQKYLRAMAELGPGPHQTGQIATTLGVGAASVATVRQQLVNKGMVRSQRHGETAFTVPLFDRFMKRQMPILEKHVPARRTGAKHRPARS